MGPLRLIKNGAAAVLAMAATLALFLVLPAINQIAEGSETTYDLEEVDTQFTEDVDEVVEEEEQEEEEEPEETEEPELEPEPLEDLSLQQLELMMNAGEGLGDTGAGGIQDMSSLIAQAAESIDEMIDADALDDGRPVPISDNPPNLSASEKKATPGRVVVIYQINPQGRTQNVKVRSATNDVLRRATLRAAKKWRYQPPKKDGRGVTVRAQRTIKFADQR